MKDFSAILDPKEREIISSLNPEFFDVDFELNEEGKVFSLHIKDFGSFRRKSINALKNKIHEAQKKERVQNYIREKKETEFWFSRIISRPLILYSKDVKKLIVQMDGKEKTMLQMEKEILEISFQNLSQLQELKEIYFLNADINDFNFIEVCQQITSLKIIDFLGDSISLPDAFNNLEILDISSKGISNKTTFVLGLKNYPKLKQINIKSIAISDISIFKNCFNLTKLYVSSNYILDISPLNSFKNLEELDLSHNRIHNISGIQHCIRLKKLNFSNNKIENISPLKSCKNLKKLDLSNNNIKDIFPLKSCKNLVELDLSNNKIINISPLRDIIYLKKLSLSRNKIQDISFLKKCSNISHLSIDHNHIKDITVINSFDKLSFITNGNNDIKKIPARIFNLIYNLKEDDIDVSDVKELKNLVVKHQDYEGAANLRDIEKEMLEAVEIGAKQKNVLMGKYIKYIQKKLIETNCLTNPLESPPKEIIEQGEQAVKNYFDLLEKEQAQQLQHQYNFEAKLLIIGEGGTGKTTLLRRLIEPSAPIPQEDETTLGVNIHKWSFKLFPDLFPNIPDLNQDELDINCWDFGGQKLYHGTHQIFFSENSFYILVAETREQKTDFNYWFNTIEQLVGDQVTLLVVINKKFGHILKFDKEGFSSRYPFVKKVIELDLKEDYDEIIELQKIVKTRLHELPHVGSRISATYSQIRERLFDIEKSFISLDTFINEICSRYDLTNMESIRVMSRYFNEIGTIVHFIDDPILKNRVYLNSDWLVKNIYQVLDNPLIKEKQGRILKEDFQSIWQGLRLDFEIDHLSQLMHKFGLMYRVSLTDQYVIPAHLPTQKPYAKWQHEEEGTLLRFTYEFDKFMPAGLMSHFIVALHDYIEDDIVWHKGLNLIHDRTYAEIIETYGGTNTFEIKICGALKPELLAIIRHHFSKILKPFKKLTPKELIPCNCEECKISDTPHFYEYQKLLEIKGRGKRDYELCNKSDETVYIDELLNSVIISPGQISSSTRKRKKFPPKIFISYSHKDAKHLEIVRKHLKTMEYENLQFDLWDDTKIKGGMNWKEEITQNLSQASIAILLISTDFLISDFINQEELPPLLQKASEQGTDILPLILKPCRFSKRKTLSCFQPINSEDHALSGLSDHEQEKVLLKLVERVDELIGGKG